MSRLDVNPTRALDGAGEHCGAPKTGKRPRHRIARALLVGVLWGYGVILLLLFLTQESLIFPGHSSQGNPEARLTPPAGAELVRLQAHKDRIVALYGAALTETGAPRPDAPHCPTLLYFYGNGTWLGVSKGTFSYLRRLGVNVLIPEYAGYGMSTGEAGESGCYAAADAAYDHLTRTRHVPARQLVVTGGSLGGAVAIDLAARKPVAALATFNTFTSMTDMAGQIFPWAPSGLLLRHRFESARKIRRARTPTFIAAGDADTFIPPTMSARLASSAGGPVTRIVVRGAEHGSLPTNGTPEFDTAFRAFVEQVRHVSAGPF